MEAGTNCYGKKQSIHLCACECVFCRNQPSLAALIPPPASIHSCGGDTDTGRSQHISCHNDSPPARFKRDKGPKTHSRWKNRHYLSPAETITGPMQNKPNAFLMSYRAPSHKLLFFYYFWFPASTLSDCGRAKFSSFNIILHPWTEMRLNSVAKSPRGHLAHPTLTKNNLSCQM